jgi:putative salt-induced outer membrane protein YdiY
MNPQTVKTPRLFRTTLAKAICLAVLLSTLNTTRAADAAPPEPPKKWESVASLGLTLSRGNSENLLFNASVNTARKWTQDELLLGVSGGYGETSGEKTEDYLKGFAQWNHLFNERLYGGLRLDGMRDTIADVDYRFTVSPLIGYYFIKQTNMLLSAEAGPSLVIEKQGGEENNYFAARIGQRFEYKFPGGSKIWETLEFIPQVDDFDNWILNAEIGVSAPITKALDLRLVAQDTYDNEPAPGRKQNDFKLMAGIGYKF